MALHHLLDATFGRWRRYQGERRWDGRGLALARAAIATRLRDHYPSFEIPDIPEQHRRSAQELDGKTGASDYHDFVNGQLAKHGVTRIDDLPPGPKRGVARYTLSLLLPDDNFLDWTTTTPPEAARVAQEARTIWHRKRQSHDYWHRAWTDLCAETAERERG